MAVDKTELKCCNKCKELKNISAFGKNKTHRDGHYGACKQCRSNAAKEWNKANKDRRVNNQLLWKYGITSKIYNDMFIEQDGKCFCCQRHQDDLNRSLSVDHCHKTSKVRGLLCDQCNNVIGLIKEDVVVAKRIIEYLEVHNGDPK